jgi:hypothetical protein
LRKVGLEFSALEGYVTGVESDLAVEPAAYGSRERIPRFWFSTLSHPAPSSTAQTRGMSCCHAMAAATPFFDIGQADIAAAAGHAYDGIRN